MAIATVYFNGARVENETSCRLDISPCGIIIGSGGYKSYVQCDSDGVYVSPYDKFYRWTSSTVLDRGDIGVFTVCNSQELRMQIYRNCPNCGRTFREPILARS